MWELKQDFRWPTLWFDDREIIHGKWCLRYDTDFWQPIWDRVAKELVEEQPLTAAMDIERFDGRERLLFVAMCLGVLD